MLWPYAILGTALAILFSRKLNILMLGDEMATSLGVHVECTRMMYIAISSLLAASAVSVVGLLGFVGLIVPHMARLIIGSDYRYLIPASALLGASTLILCDTIAIGFQSYGDSCRNYYGNAWRTFLFVSFKGGLKKYAES